MNMSMMVDVSDPLRRIETMTLTEFAARYGQDLGIEEFGAILCEIGNGDTGFFTWKNGRFSVFKHIPAPQPIDEYKVLFERCETPEGKREIRCIIFDTEEIGDGRAWKILDIVQDANRDAFAHRIGEIVRPVTV